MGINYCRSFYAGQLVQFVESSVRFFSQQYRLFSLAVGFTLLLAGLPVSSSAQVDAPQGVTATAYDHHIELNWERNAEPGLQGYSIEASTDSSTFTSVAFVSSLHTRYNHFLGGWNQRRHYRIRAQAGGQLSAPSEVVVAETFQLQDDELLDMVQYYTFRYFWEHAHPVSGMIRERLNAPYVTTGGSGFGMMAILVGIERGWISRSEGFERLRKMVNFLQAAPRFRGAFAHWMNGANGQVVPFSALDDGGDLVETAFLMQGLLCVRQYFTTEDAEEADLRNDITTLWQDVNWNWYRKLVNNVLYWHWSPNHQFAINLPIRGFNESQIVYLLAIAAPVSTHKIPAQLYHSGWAGSGYTTSQSYYGYPLGVGSFRGGPLFFSHYSYLGFDPRNKRDTYANYFIRNTMHTLINRAHCIQNPYNRVGYSEDCWGLTASDDPFVGYLAHEPANSQLDNGTIAPTAALSSMPYTPNYSMQALKHFYRQLGQRLWGPYGFYDAFNLGANWYASSYLAIDQGPIICMIENHRSGLLWNLFMQNPEIPQALSAVGFVEDDTVISDLNEPSPLIKQLRLSPNPATEAVQLQLAIHAPERLQIELIDIQGRIVSTLLPASQLAAGEHNWTFPLGSLGPGYYGLLFTTTQHSWVEPLLVSQP